MRDADRQSLALGFFDGVHLGHRAILSGADRALTFRRHPLAVLAPARAPRLIMSLDDRLAAIRACGVRDVTVLDFTPELAATSPEEFAARHLVAADGSRVRIRCGANWNFGKGGAADADWLRARGYDVAVVPFAEYDGAPISSSRIRAALAAGDVAAAAAMLGRPFRAVGETFAGKGLGRTLGFPTVNARLVACETVLPRGVYEVAVGGVRGVANYGVAPTTGARQWPAPVLEIHFVGCAADAVPAGPTLAVDFLRFVRPEKKFDSLDALRAQVARDACI